MDSHVRLMRALGRSRAQARDGFNRAFTQSRIQAFATGRFQPDSGSRSSVRLACVEHGRHTRAVVLSAGDCAGAGAHHAGSLRASRHIVQRSEHVGSTLLLSNACSAVVKHCPHIQLPWWPSTNGCATVHDRPQKSHRKSSGSIWSLFDPGRCMMTEYARPLCFVQHGETESHSTKSTCHERGHRAGDRRRHGYSVDSNSRVHGGATIAKHARHLRGVGQETR